MPARTAANSGTFEVTTPSDREIRMTRLFDAPRELVFDVLTRPEHVRRWWGNLSDKHGVSVCEIDLRVGGAWRFVGFGPEGPYPAFYGTYEEIARPSRLVNTEFFEPYPDAGSLVVTELAEEGGKTRLMLTASYPSKDVRDLVLGTGMETGAATSYDRMEDVLSELQGS
jgi:uncharacterized protein YndB with AHSA1/START domain